MALTFICAAGHRERAMGASGGEFLSLQRTCPLCGAKGDWVQAPEHYTIRRVLGRGGMGVVYEALNTETSQRIALKSIHPHKLGDRESLTRFSNEAEILARLDHPNIVKIVELHLDPDCCYFAMEFVDGGDLSDRLKKERPSMEDAIRLIMTVARAIHYVHRLGIIHRDLKPNNILLGPDGQLKITDFGLAKILAQKLDLTSSNIALGTPLYMSPEQARGRKSTHGPASDIYSLGCILYELLTGKCPFCEGSPLDILHQIIYKFPPRPSSENPAIPTDLETICLTCLQKQEDKRYRTAEELADDLDRFLRSEPIKARASELAPDHMHMVILEPGERQSVSLDVPVPYRLDPDPSDSISAQSAATASLPTRLPAEYPDGDLAETTKELVAETTGALDEDIASGAFRIDLFEGMSYEQVQALLKSAARIERENDEIIFNKGDVATGLFIIIQGEVCIYSMHGDCDHEHARLLPGKVFGEIGLLPRQGRRTASARAVGRTTLLLVPGNPVELITHFAEAATAVQLFSNLLRLLGERLFNKQENEANRLPPRQVRVRAGGIDPRMALVELNELLSHEPCRKLSVTIDVAADDFLFHEGEKGDGFYIVHDGIVEIIPEAGSGAQSPSRLIAPCLIGELALFPNSRRSIGIQAITDLKCAHFSSTQLRILMREHPRAALKIMLALAQFLTLLILEQD